MFLTRRHGELVAFRSHFLLERVDVRDTKCQLIVACRMILRGRMKCQDGVSGFEFAPPWRLEAELGAKCIAVERDCLIHVGDEIDDIVEFDWHGFDRR